MQRIYFVQRWFNLSDPAAEDASDRAEPRLGQSPQRTSGLLHISSEPFGARLAVAVRPAQHSPSEAPFELVDCNRQASTLDLLQLDQGTAEILGV